MSDDPNSVFKPGTEVEISSDDNGFRGAWYTGTVIKPVIRNGKQLIQVEYKTLMADESTTKPLRETLNVVQLRPLPPREKGERDFKFSEEVDAYYNDGWWEGVITGVLQANRYSVFFRATREQLEFSATELRLHREWFYGNWVPPSKNLR
ncbi:protein AGENET DOMAIN (AGD)-CONTAINING P1-like [Bidens hawaiensis]|uniref:protein AGENET DOMAIN (AGD)-CONTAINING P1-like n=1 Tax=Bidens hawaiensis TaxID=980011 RepID=UPI0040491429